MEDHTTNTTTPPTQDAHGSNTAWQALAEQGLEIAQALWRDRNAERRWKIIRRTTWIAIILAIGFVQFVRVGGIRLFPVDPAVPTVSIVDIKGEISSSGNASAENLVPLITRACAQDKVTGLILNINSPGGDPAEAARIGAAIDTCHTGAHPKKVEAVVQSLDASAAYLISVHADTIIANPFALVGSIGAIMTTMEGQDALAQLGVKGNVYASGPIKSLGAWFKHDTPAQALVAQQLVNEAAANFEDEVKRLRGKRLHDDPELFSGRVWTAQKAMGLGLIDRIDVIDNVVKTDFPGAAVQRLAPHRALSEALGMQTFIHSLSHEIVEAMQTPQFH